MNVPEAIRASLRLLTRRDRRLFILTVAIQMATSVLDLAGVALIGLFGLLAISMIAGSPPPKLVLDVSSALGLGNWSHTALVAAGFGVALLLIKSVLSPLLIGHVLRFLARREAVVSARLTEELLSRPLTFVQQRSTQETATILNMGTNAAVTVVLGQSAVAGAETALLIVLAVALLLIHAGVALGAIAFFGAVGFGLHRLLGQRAGHYAAARRRAETASLVALQEAVGTFRQIFVSDRRSYYVDRMKKLRADSAHANAGIQLVAMLPRYVSEAALVAGSCVLAAFLFATQPVDIAAGTVTLFLAAATRVMPALLRLQSALLAIRSAAGTARPTFALAEELRNPKAHVRQPPAEQPPLGAHLDFAPSIELREVSFTYPGGDTPAVHRITLTVQAGQSVALVGRSGSGKSTLGDLILGVLEPDAGVVAVGGLSPGDAVRRWPGGIGYVPQEVMLVNDSVRRNVALGFPRELVDDGRVWEALERSHLADFFSGQPDSLDLQIGERGLRLSGGQRQRLGIARALFTRPRLVVLDEATSALDAETERAITETLDELESDVTTVIVAHRLSTVRNADLVVYLCDGAIVATGNFDDVCTRVPALEHQAALMGLRAQD